MEERNSKTEQRRNDQSYQASKMIRMNQRPGFSINIGDPVAFFPDGRDRATRSRLGIHCLVIGVSRGSYPSIRVMIPEGIIGDKKLRTSTWFPHDRYNVMHPSSPLGTERRKIQTQILNQTFDSRSYPIISVRGAHRVTYSSQRSIKKKQPMLQNRKVKCSCKRLGIQCSTDNCGCRKAGVVCSHHCKCLDGQCMNRRIHGTKLPGNDPNSMTGSDVPKNRPTV